MRERVRPILEDFTGANEARMLKLRANRLQSLAKKQGLALRHSDRGYALFDRLRERVIVDDHASLTLDEVEGYFASKI